MPFASFLFLMKELWRKHPVLLTGVVILLIANLFHSGSWQIFTATVIVALFIRFVLCDNGIHYAIALLVCLISYLGVHVIYGMNNEKITAFIYLWLCLLASYRLMTFRNPRRNTVTDQMKPDDEIKSNFNLNIEQKNSKRLTPIKREKTIREERRQIQSKEHEPMRNKYLITIGILLTCLIFVIYQQGDNVKVDNTRLTEAEHYPASEGWTHLAEVGWVKEDIVGGLATRIKELESQIATLKNQTKELYHNDEANYKDTKKLAENMSNSQVLQASFVELLALSKDNRSLAEGNRDLIKLLTRQMMKHHGAKEMLQALELLSGANQEKKKLLDDN